MAAGGEGGGGPGPAGVVPTEDAVNALMEHLVDPLLPQRSYSQEPPSVAQQQAVATQMHAVVLLYNYYHRKQFQQVEFLDFESFCKVASIAKQSLLMYMKSMHKTEESVELDKQLSITEKMIMDACNISMALDASKDSPVMQDWPVFKVAVFLVDPMKEKCLLSFGSMMQGVWSLVEKELDTAVENLAANVPTKDHKLKNMRTGCGSSNGSQENEKLRQLAFSAVEQKTGIDSSNLCILESHLAYSLSQEKTVSQFYIMKYMTPEKSFLPITSLKYTKPASGFQEVAIKDVVSRLKGPVVKSSSFADIAAVSTEVVEYFHLLPYIDVISDWLCRETPCDSSLHPQQQQIDADVKSLLKSTGVPYHNDHNITNQCDLNMLSDKKNKTIKRSTNKAGNNQSSNCRPCGSASVPQTNTVNPPMEPGKPPTEDQAVSHDSHQSRKEMNISIGKKRIKDAGKNNGSIGSSCLSGSSVAVCRPQDKAQNLTLDYDPHQQSNTEDMRSWENIMLDTSSDKKNSIQVAANDATNGPSGKDDMIHLPKTSSMIENVDGEHLDTKMTCDVAQDVLATPDLPLTPVQNSSEKCHAFHLVMASKKSDLLKAALRALQKRRDDLCKQQRLLEDEISQCEMNIQTITSEGEESWMSKVELITEVCNALCSSQMPLETSCSREKGPDPQMKRRRLSEAVLSLRSSCQELDAICSRNSWMLPKYDVFPYMEDGKFQARVKLKGLDFEFTVCGDSRGSPQEARESAATQLLSQLRSSADQRGGVNSKG